MRVAYMAKCTDLRPWVIMHRGRFRTACIYSYSEIQHSRCTTVLGSIRQILHSSDLSADGAFLPMGTDLHEASFFLSWQRILRNYFAYFGTVLATASKYYLKRNMSFHQLAIMVVRYPACCVKTTISTQNKSTESKVACMLRLKQQ
jgi:hypothetical protein